MSRKPAKPAPAVLSNKPTAQKKVTIAATYTFQAALAANPSRSGARIQNNGANNMYLVFDPNSTLNPGAGILADLTTAITIPLNTTFDLASQSGVVGNDKVWLAGTAGDVAVCIEN
jgi:hypothetical protein